MQHRGRAFAPGHISGFFQICDEAPEPAARGSRGGGICLAKGAWCDVEISDSSGRRSRYDIFINGARSAAPVTRAALDILLGDRKLCLRVETHHQLPVSQGFGMSGAGALGACLAAAQAAGLALPCSAIVTAAHRAEVECRTGLGDVAAQAVGGVELRREPGVPPYGWVDKLPVPSRQEVVLAIVGPPIETKRVLASPAKRRAINAAGERAVEASRSRPTLENLILTSYRFAKESHLMSARVAKAVEAARPHGRASMSMLGNSVFAVGETHALIRALKRFGEVFVTRVDDTGARVV